MTDEIKFPLLKASDIDVRIDDLREIHYNGSSYIKCRLLLYKNARVDMKYLDAMFGPMNWQRKHTLINNELFCSIEVWDHDKKCWVCKEDVGVASNYQAEKGRASDCFKRAAVNWGSGRELYTAPSITFNLAQNEASIDGKKIKVAFGVSFHVGHIAYNEDREITELVILDANGYGRFFYPASLKTSYLEQHPEAAQAPVQYTQKPVQNAQAAPRSVQPSSPQGQSQARNVSQPSGGNSGAVNVRSAPSPYMCLNCGVEISQTVRRISVEKTGKALCMSCRNKALSNK